MRRVLPCTYEFIFKGCQHWQGGLILFKVPCDMLQIVHFCRMSISLVCILCFCASALKRARHWRAGLTWPDLTCNRIVWEGTCFLPLETTRWLEGNIDWNLASFRIRVRGLHYGQVIFFLFKIACALTPGCHLGVQADLTWPVGSKMGSIHSPPKKLLPKWLTEILPSPIFNVNQLVAYTRFYQLGQWLSLAQDPALWMQLNDDFVKFCSTTSSWCFGLTLPAPQRELPSDMQAQSQSQSQCQQIKHIKSKLVWFSVTASFSQLRRVLDNAW